MSIKTHPLLADSALLESVSLRTLIAVAVGAILLVRYISYARGKVHLPGPLALPIFGNLLSLGTDAALTMHKWSKQYGDVFKVTLGEREIVIINTAAATKELLSDQGGVYISRPRFHNFHGVLSSTAGMTIGTSPWDESCKRKRKAAATALNKTFVNQYVPIIDREALALVEDLYTDGKGGAIEIDPSTYLSRFALNTSLSVNYGCRLGGVGDELLNEIIYVESGVSTVRSVTSSWTDYVPLLRHMPGYKSGHLAKANEMRIRRDRYMDILLQDLKDRIKTGTDVPCITGTILKDPENKLDAMELSSICLSMVSAGLDTLGNTLIWAVGYLAQHPDIWEKAYTHINEVCGGEIPDSDEAVEYVSALHREALRYFSVLKLSLPRETMGDSTYRGVHIPDGTTVFLNAWAVHHDADKYENHDEFKPERFLKGQMEKDTKDGAQSHYSFGAGRRMCAGNHLANREMYVAFSKLIYFFKVDVGSKPFDINPETACANPYGLAATPHKFKMRFIARNPETIEQWIADEQSRNELKLASSVSANAVKAAKAAE